MRVGGGANPETHRVPDEHRGNKRSSFVCIKVGMSVGNDDKRACGDADGKIPWDVSRVVSDVFARLINGLPDVPESSVVPYPCCHHYAEFLRSRLHNSTRGGDHCGHYFGEANGFNKGNEGFSSEPKHPIERLVNILTGGAVDRHR